MNDAQDEDMDDDAGGGSLPQTRSIARGASTDSPPNPPSWRVEARR